MLLARTVTLGLACSALVPAVSRAATESTAALESDLSPSAGLEVDLPSRYISRGIALNEGPAVQPSAWLGLAGASVTAWTSFDPALTSQTGPRPTDFNGVLAHEVEVGRLSVAPSVTWITFPGLAGTPQSVELALDTNLSAGPVSLCVTNVLDALAFSGAWYGRVGLCAEHTLAAGFDVSADASVSGGNETFHRANAGVATSGLGHAEANLALTVPTPGGTYLRLHGTYSRLLNPALVAAIPEHQLGLGGVAFGAAL
jgi:hypothetical protein